jgi:hypothetical protein
MQPSQHRHDDVMPRRQSSQAMTLSSPPSAQHCTDTLPSATGDSTMNATLPPEAWRSEAFAEDLADEPTDAVAAGSHRGTVVTLLLGALPVALAAAGAMAVVWSGA